MDNVRLIVGELDANLPATMETMRQEIQAGFTNSAQVHLTVIKKAGIFQ